jgi:hypothetical protein
MSGEYRLYKDYYSYLPINMNGDVWKSVIKSKLGKN